VKGIIFNLLESFISEGWGEDKYEEIFAACPLHTREPFVGPQSYPDADLLMIVAKAAEKLGIAAPAAVHAFGKYCFPKLAAKYPIFVRDHSHPKPFLQTIDNVIHVEVRKLFKDATPPRMTFVDPAPNELVMTYSSSRQLCALVGGLIEGVADYFHSPIRYEQTQCTQRGAPACEFHLTFATGHQASA
jgi:predicted hydrocarbon binding protein